MDYFLHGFGVFLGVVAGTAVTILSQWFVQWRSETQKVKNLKFELNLDIKKIDGWLAELIDYRNAVNSDTLHLYYGFFDFSKIISVTVYDMFERGRFYKYLDHDIIEKLQALFQEFTQKRADIINDQIDKHRENLDKEEAVKQINFNEKKWKEHKKTLEEILKKLN